MRKSLALLFLFVLSACAPAGPATQPNDREWTLLSADYQWIQTLRAAQKPIPPGAPRKQQIEIVLENRQKLAPTYDAFLAKVEEYHDRRIVGFPREDWIKQVVQNGRVYAVWIYPKADGGASAIYFDNGVVYHTNWNAAAPPVK